MDAWKKLVVNRRVLVHLLSGSSFSGIVWERRGPLLVLRSVQMLEAGRDPVALDGDVIVEVAKVDWIQALGGH